MLGPLSRQDADRETLLGAAAPAAQPRARSRVARVVAFGLIVAAGAALLAPRRSEPGISAAVGSADVGLFSFDWTKLNPSTELSKLNPATYDWAGLNPVTKLEKLNPTSHDWTKLNPATYDWNKLNPCTMTDCRSCAAAPECRWCPATSHCHLVGSLVDLCDAPINSANQCWGEGCAYQLGEFLNNRPDDAKQWIEQTVMTRMLALWPFRTYLPPSTGMFDLATGQTLTDPAGGGAVNCYTIAAIADWGTGTCAARSVARLAAAEDPDMTVHMGDIYFVATPEQVLTNFVGLPKSATQQGVAFPKGKQVTFAMMGNHEQISGGEGLYDFAFPYTGQQTTYAAWQSDSWRIVALDTGRLCYPTDDLGRREVELGETDAPMPSEVVDWLKNTLNLGDPSDKRGIVLLSHHQPYDAFSTAYLGAANQLNDILPKGKQVVWLFGHNHALAIYKKMQLRNMDFVMYPRLLGIGGFPNILQKPKKTEGLLAYDARTFQSIPNDIGGKQNIGFNGYAKLVINGSNLEIFYITADCANGDCDEGLSDMHSTVVASETFTADLTTGSIAHTGISIDNETMTHVNDPVDEVASVSCIPQSALGNYDASLNHYD